MRASTKFRWAAGFLLVLHVVVIFAGFIAPYDYQSQDRLHPFAPPARVHLVDCSGKLHLHPFVYGLKDSGQGFGSYAADCGQVLPLHFFVHGDEYSLLGIFHPTLHLFGVDAPAQVNVLGSDGFGRDQFSRLLYGGQVSLFAGLLAALLALSGALLVGAISGLYGGLTDDALMRLAEVAVAVPSFYLLLAVRSLLPLRTGPVVAFLLVVCIIGFLSWARPARLVRGVVLSGRERNFVLAARGFGASRSYLLRRHLMPMTFPVLITQMVVLVPQFILAEVLLSFLGLGISEPFPSWGNMLAYAQQYHILVS
ncbi:MAG TPA: ABC transporter permease, partial [Candidatus Acidoferrales bacterium]|nr:ABC transporter permease [Candidatus Acidoferrales bacterium]